MGGHSADSSSRPRTRDKAKFPLIVVLRTIEGFQYSATVQFSTPPRSTYKQAYDVLDSFVDRLCASIRRVIRMRWSKKSAVETFSASKAIFLYCGLHKILSCKSFLLAFRDFDLFFPECGEI